MMRKLMLSIGAALVVTILATQAYTSLRPYVAGLSAQEALWLFYRSAGWWWWGLAIVMSGAGMALLFTLSPPRNKSTVVARMFLLTGFLLHCGSWGNNALGPLANMLVLGGTVLILWQVSIYDIRQRRINPLHHPSLAHRALWFLTRDNRMVGR